MLLFCVLIVCLLFEGHLDNTTDNAVNKSLLFIFIFQPLKSLPLPLQNQPTPLQVSLALRQACILPQAPLSLFPTPEDPSPATLPQHRVPL